LTAGSGKTCAIDCVIEAALQQEQKVLAGDALHTRSPLEVVTKLSFKNEVDAFDFLLLAQLLAVTDQRFAAAQRAAMLSGRLGTAFLNRASGFITTIALQKELCTFTTAKATHCISIPSQLFASSLYQTEKFTGGVVAGTDPSSFGLFHFRLPIANFRFR
jgi:hypothetical protein